MSSYLIAAAVGIPDVQTITLLLGAVLLILGVVGGNIEGKGVKVPALLLPARIISGALGLTLIVFALRPVSNHDKAPDTKPSTSVPPPITSSSDSSSGNAAQNGSVSPSKTSAKEKGVPALGSSVAGERAQQSRGVSSNQTLITPAQKIEVAGNWYVPIDRQKHGYLDGITFKISHISGSKDILLKVTRTANQSRWSGKQGDEIRFNRWPEKLVDVPMYETHLPDEIQCSDGTSHKNSRVSLAIENAPKDFDGRLVRVLTGYYSPDGCKFVVGEKFTVIPAQLADQYPERLVH